MSYPLVTVITVSLNTEKTIEQTIKSVLGQTYQGKIEYIIVDGGSTDDTLEIIEKYRESISKVVSEKDEGIYDAINKGISMASGDIIGLIHSTDWYEADAVELSVKNFTDNDIDISVGAQNWFTGNDFYRTQEVDTNLEHLWKENIIPHLSTFVKRSVYERFGGYDTSYRIAADYKFFFECYLQGMKYGFVNKATSNFRLGGASSNCIEMACEDARMIRGLIAEYFENEGEKLLEEKQVYYSGAYAMGLLAKHPSVAADKLKNMLGTDFSIWGLGRYGTLFLDFFIENDMQPTHIVDRNYESFANADCIVESIDSLENYKGTLFVSFKQSDDSVIEQANHLHVGNIVLLDEVFYELGKIFFELEG